MTCTRLSVEASLSSAAAATARSEVRWWCACSDDVTERNEARAALILRAQNDLARVTRATALGELATSIAHEINQPLAARDRERTRVPAVADRASCRDEAEADGGRPDGSFEMPSGRATSSAGSGGSSAGAGCGIDVAHRSRRDRGRRRRSSLVGLVRPRPTRSSRSTCATHGSAAGPLVADRVQIQARSS